MSAAITTALTALGRARADHAHAAQLTSAAWARIDHSECPAEWRRGLREEWRRLQRARDATADRVDIATARVMELADDAYRAEAEKLNEADRAAAAGST